MDEWENIAHEGPALLVLKRKKNRFDLSFFVSLFRARLPRRSNKSDRNLGYDGSNGRAAVATAAAAGPAHTSSGATVEGVAADKGEEEQVVEVSRRELQGCAEKRVFAAPKTPVPVEWRRQRAQKPGDHRVMPVDVPVVPPMPPFISLPLEQLTDRRHSAIDSPLMTAESAHSVKVPERVETSQVAAECWPKHKKIDNQCGFFRQILSEDEVVYDMPNNQKPTSPEPLPAEEAVYAEPSMHSVCSTLTSFGERRPKFGVFPSSADDDDICDSSHYADPFERYYANSLQDHSYEEMDDDEDYHQNSLPHPRARPADESKENTESGFSDGSSSNSRPNGYFTSDSGASLTIPPGLARSRAALFESIAQANQRVIRPFGTRKLVQALGPQLALYSLSSLPESAQSVKTSKSCPPSLNAINWSVETCAENDGFFMEFSNQRIALPEPDSAVTSCSGSDASSGETDSTDRSAKSSRKVSFVLGPVRPIHNRLLCHKLMIAEEEQSLLVSQKAKSNHSTHSKTAHNLARFFKQTFTVIGRCSGQVHLSDTESLVSYAPDDLLSQSDLEMFCKSSVDKRERKDSGTDMTTPDTSLSDSTLADDIDAALAILEVKAKSRQAEKIPDVCSSEDDDDTDSSSCSSASSCESSCNLTDCTSWTDSCWTSESSSDVSRE